MEKRLLFVSLFLISILFISGCDTQFSKMVFRDGTAYLEIQNVNFYEGTLQVYVENTVEIGGFQFKLTGITIDEIFGGSSVNLDSVNFNDNTNIILGFSFNASQDNIPSGDGILINVGFSNNVGDICFGNSLSENVLSDIYGNPIGYNAQDYWLGDCYYGGCTNYGACNYDSDADYNDGSCEYPEENYDCDGNCINEDCAGVCGGSAVEDICGICGGDGSSCEDPVVCGDSSYPGYLDEGIYENGGCECAPQEWYDYTCNFVDPRGPDIGLSQDIPFKVASYNEFYYCKAMAEHEGYISEEGEYENYFGGEVYSYMTFDCNDCEQDSIGEWWLKYDTTEAHISKEITCEFAYCSQLGDLNGDGYHNMLDIVTLINYVLDNNEGACSADVNQDGGYNVLDVNALVNCVLGNNC